MPEEASLKRSRLLVLAFLSLLSGSAAGVLAAAFRLALSFADRLRGALIALSHSEGIVGLFAVAGLCAAATAVASWLVQRFSAHSVGSGIAHVVAQLGGNWSGNPLAIIFVKFFGGLLAIGAGLAPGREGPTVQMGGSSVGRVSGRHRHRTLLPGSSARLSSRGHRLPRARDIAGPPRAGNRDRTDWRRFLLGAVSYAARTPGGQFAPMLVIGSQCGLLFGTLCQRMLPGAGINPTAYAVVGMAALFTAVVRAPVTGIILAIELTGSFTCSSRCSPPALQPWWFRPC